eukprot:6559698-Prymnesium_polylepis.1
MVGELRQLTSGTLDFFIPDHRGTGRSSPLFCDVGNSTATASPACVSAAATRFGLDYLHSFSTSNAARD